jgi:translation initiation factor RLI1
MCPVPEKAIRLEEASVVAADGREQVLQRPVVLRELYTGCGICEHRCPMAGLAAIRVLRA